MKTCFATLTLSLTGLLLSGCSSLLPEAQPDPTRYYVLTAPGAATAATGDTVLGLRNVEVAAYLRSRSLIVRKGENEVEFREYARWGEALDAGLARTLREHLLTADTIAQVVVVPFPLELVRDYDVAVRVLACEGDRDGRVHFRAAWELWSVGAGADIVERGDYVASGVTWDGRTEASLAAGLSRAVAMLGAEISAAVGRQ
jgi:uncharacterized lipoprotein YmbA